MTQYILDPCAPRGAKLAEAMDDKYFKRVVFSSESTPFKWLSSFADLHDLVGAK